MDGRLISVVAVVMGCLMLAVPGSAQNGTDVSVGTLTGCDPAVNGSCLFVSTRPATTTRTTEVSFQLRGSSTGYIAVGLSTDDSAGGNDSFYICVNNVSSVIFLTAVLDNDVLTVCNLSVSAVLGSVSGDVIQCSFTAEGLNATRLRGPATSFFVILASGTFINGQPGDPDIVLITSLAVDLTTAGNGTNPTAIVPLANATMTTSNARQHVSHGLLLLIGLLLLCL
ncbi:hypothetical protein AAFF_G00277340 [Aldrovandia affinis]|uniref:Ferric-chelate reductase 1 n=1 Tax=Aldrovandia affinis TaxID=143900 RepID=A0AAD7RA75_9TELE|nr:hypothetical protein AAFF_G00277340 [Aldrovandia affinis]